MSRALVVDDEYSIRLSVGEFLRDAGYETAVAASAQEAQTILSNQSFDVVLSDIILPGASGVELLKVIRHASPEIQVIMMTGEPTVDTAAEAVRAGAIDYLAKPVTKAAILRSVTNALRVKELDDERRRLEALNAAYQEELEQRVAERTRELEQALQKLREAHDNAIKQERLNAISQMASGIAHDFNNALTPILGMTDLILGDPDILDDREDTLDILGAVGEAAKDARHIVKRLKQVYKPEKTELAEINIAEVIDSAVTLTSLKWKEEARAEGRTIYVTADCEKAVPIMGNEVEIREMLINLIFNAVDAMPDGGTISVKAGIDGSKMMAVEVKDSGMGMDEATVEKCLEPYFTTKGSAGTGLGLPMVSSIMVRHQGRMELESKRGTGTTIRLLFPTGGIGHATPALSEDDVPAHSPLRVLAIDDDLRSRRLLMHVLKKDGHSVVLSEGTEQGIRAFREGEFDVVITDRAMPDGGGDRVAEEIKTMSPSMPIIMLTGFGDVMDAKNTLPKGVDLVIGKPLAVSGLRKAFETVLKDRPTVVAA